MSLNEKYGLTSASSHDLAEDGICKKCHVHISKLKMKLCPVIGPEEVARFRDYDDR